MRRRRLSAWGCVGSTVAVALLWFVLCLLRGLSLWLAVFVVHDYWWSTVPRIDFWVATAVATLFAQSLDLSEWRSSRK